MSPEKRPMKRPPPTTANLRRLLLNWELVDRDGGPGTKPDSRGSWHLFCHLAAAGAIRRLSNGGAAWVGIHYDRRKERYEAAVFTTLSGRVVSLPLRSRETHRLLEESELCAYIEGASRGRILDRDANDAGDPTKDDRRQDYNQSPSSPKDGGPVWEMWTVSRDIRPGSPLGNSSVEAYAELLSVLGGRFASVVARGRMEPEYGHLRQMCAMVDAGFITPEEALTDIDAVAIPTNVERILLEATPEAFATAADMLVKLRKKPCYWMYSRKVSSFATASLLRRLVGTLAPAVVKSPKAKRSGNRRR